MRLEKTTFRNWGNFVDLTIDFAALPPEHRLLAITGPNGVGKSTMLEGAFAGALYRKTPTRGTLVDRAMGKDSMVESRVVNGRAWTIRHMLDNTGAKPKSETLVFDEGGKPAYKSTKVSDFDAWAARHLPTPEVFFACNFAAQQSTGLIQASPGDVKAVVLRLMGVEGIEGLAKGARDRGRITKEKLDDLRARVQDERARGGDLEAIDREIISHREALAGAEASLEVARDELAAARDMAPIIERDRQVAKALRERRSELETRIAAKRAEVEQTSARIANNRGLLEGADEIRKAAERSKALDVEIATLTEEVKAAEERLAAAERERDQHLAADKAARKRAAAAGERTRRARERAADRDRVAEAAASLEALEAVVAESQATESRGVEVLEQMRGQRVAGAEDRIGRLRVTLTDVRDANDLPEDGDARARLESVAFHAGEALDLDDAIVATATDLPKQIALADYFLVIVRDRLAVQTRALADARALAARTADVDAAEAEAMQADEEARAAGAEAEGFDRQRIESSERGTVAERERLAAQDRRRAHQAERSELATMANKADHLSRAEGRIAELEPHLETARTELATLEKTLAETPEPTEPAEAPDVEALEARAGAAELAARAAARSYDEALARRHPAVIAAARIAELEVDRARLESELSDWTKLAADLGRDGVQALLVDAAGPEIMTLANDLLFAAFGPRFSVRLDTQRIGAEGQTIETYEPIVIDTEKGREGPARTLSGGERVWVAEALSLAMTMVSCRQHGIERPTLVRDEAAAALDPEHSRQWVAMLRRCAELVNVDRILLVSHTPEVQALCDMRFDVAKGEWT